MWKVILMFFIISCTSTVRSNYVHYDYQLDKKIEQEKDSIDSKRKVETTLSDYELLRKKSKYAIEKNNKRGGFIQ